MEPDSHGIIVEQTAEAGAHTSWHATCMSMGDDYSRYDKNIYNRYEVCVL